MTSLSRAGTGNARDRDWRPQRRGARAIGCRRDWPPVFLLWTSFPPFEWSWLAWIALAPLFWLVTLAGTRLKTYLAAWAGGLVFWLLALQWLRLIDVERLARLDRDGR